MTTVIFLLSVYLQGLVWTLPVRRSVGMPFLGIAAYPLGLLLWVVLCLALLVLPVPFTTAAILGLWGLLLLCGVARMLFDASRRSTVKPAEICQVGGFIVGFVAIAAMLEHWNLAVVTVDSLNVIDTGRSFAFHGTFDPGYELSNRGAFMMLAQASSIPLGVAYLPSIAPLLAISLFGSFISIGARALLEVDRGSPAGSTTSAAALALGVAVLAALVLFSPYFMLLQAFYVHANLAAAVYLFLFAVCFWRAECLGSTGWLPLAFAFLLGFSLQRVEAPIVALVILTIAWGRARVDDAVLLRFVASFSVLLGLWQLTVFMHSGPESRVLTSPRALAAAGLIAVFPAFLRLMQIRALARVREVIPGLVGAVLVLACGATWAVRPDAMASSARSLLTNVVGSAWGGIWPGILLLGALASGLPRVVGQRLFLHSGLAYLALIFLASAARRSSFQPTWQDSGNRMLVHVLPLLFFWLLLVYGRVAVRTLSARRQQPELPSGP